LCFGVADHAQVSFASNAPPCKARNDLGPFDERFAPMKEQLTKRKRPRQPANAGSIRLTWLFTKDKAREMGKKRSSLMTESERKGHQRKAGKASGRARRSKTRQQLAPMLNPDAQPGENGPCGKPLLASGQA
jgi:hypothetical protein